MLTWVVGIFPDRVRTSISAQRHDDSVASLEKGLCALWLKRKAPAQQGVGDETEG